MSSINFSSLISEFPEERDAVARLENLLRDASARHMDSANGDVLPEWTIQRLYQVSHPSSQRALARILTRLVEKGVLRQIVRVESDTHGGIGDYDSILEIPETMYDQFLGRDIDVRIDQVKTVYSLRNTLHVE